MTNARKIGRNDPCPCGSGKKFKKCCLDSERLDDLSSDSPQSVQTPSVLRSALQDEEALPAYDPFTEPDPDLWVVLDEEERIDLVMAYHRRVGIPLPREKVHAILHVIVESQIADPTLPVRSEAQRLMSEGLDRHEAIHAIGSVLAGHMNELMRETKSGDDNVETKPDQDPNETYFAQLKLLTADEWRRSG
ncbi:hypothetical protein GGD65_005098 [Bradyrhizobium sp. CIR18]|uniref:YecA family protein n=1 Tax=Bradyrhizobium sp. CIR18 TaxID=2663839 RepID=UPI0017B6602A|nr:SEC-C metal-binding domain-containing protein [Bradyrhizobium sp. CIR18]MBB4364044.1 hypothetical protein [Bradyrhizobium sp. CIR18]